jgi:hypothetical protein
VIFVTIPFDNDVGAMWRFEAINKMVRNFCKSWKPSNATMGVQQVLYLDFRALMHDLIKTNAHHIGIAGTNDTTYMMQRLNFTPFPPSIAQACAELPSDVYQRSCKRTVISADGKHPCMETVGARINAGLACLLNCAFDEDLTTPLESRHCEANCNRRFMSVAPVDASMFAVS